MNQWGLARFVTHISSEEACKKKLAHELGLPLFLLSPLVRETRGDPDKERKGLSVQGL